MISPTGADSDSYEIYATNWVEATGSSPVYGYNVGNVDLNTIQVQTGLHGLVSIQGDGTVNVIDSEDWYYKIMVYKLK